ncbi:hypothetical protein JAMGFMIE_01629 [Rheinheimera sp. MM224]|nr:hypothetical protein JAMGFMIE_01629 [Rheinheimera sp. MM224]
MLSEWLSKEVYKYQADNNWGQSKIKPRFNFTLTP